MGGWMVRVALSALAVSWAAGGAQAAAPVPKIAASAAASPAPVFHGPETRDHIALSYSLPHVSTAEAAVFQALESKLNAMSQSAVSSAVTALMAAETAAAAGGTAMILGRANALAAERAVRDAWLAEDALLAGELTRVSAETGRAVRAAVLAERAAFLSLWGPWRIAVFRSLGFAAAAVDEAARAAERATAATQVSSLSTDAGVKAAGEALSRATEVSILAAQSGAAVGAAAARVAADAARASLVATHDSAPVVTPASPAAEPTRSPAKPAKRRRHRSRAR